MTRRFHPFDHIDEKLERAVKHLGDLQTEIDALFSTLPYDLVSDDDPEAHDDLLKSLRELTIPPPIPILAGEAIHQLRSSLDHIASALVLSNNGKITRATQFPICPYRPSTEKESLRYENQIRGMTPSAKALIDGLQPCNHPDILDNPLTLLNRLNNFDKHQALLVTTAVTRPLVHFTVDGHRLTTDDLTDPVYRLFGKDVEASFKAHVVFPEFGTAKNEPVVPAILGLWAHVAYSVRTKFKIELNPPLL